MAYYAHYAFSAKYPSATGNRRQAESYMLNVIPNLPVISLIFKVLVLTRVIIVQRGLYVKTMGFL